MGDSQGKVIGVNTAILSPSGASAGIGFALPIDQVKALVTQIIAFGAVIRPKLGIGMAPDQMYSQIRSQANHLRPGVLVLQAEDPALSAGVRPTTRDMGSNGQIFLGDIILSIDNVPTPSTEVLLAQMDKKKYTRPSIPLLSMTTSAHRHRPLMFQFSIFCLRVG